MPTRIMKVGIISKKNYIKRTLAIAKGEYKPRKDEPKVWFESIKSMYKISLKPGSTRSKGQVKDLIENTRTLFIPVP